MVGEIHEGTDADSGGALGAGEDTQDHGVERLGRPQEEAALDRSTGDFDEAFFGDEA